MSNRLNAQEELCYPCAWLYKVIGTNGEIVRNAVAAVLPEGGYAVTFSNISRRGNYSAFNVEITIQSQEQRDEIYRKLKSHPDIKTVL